MTIDLANLEWWQTLVGIIGVIGLSPAPWITALLLNKLMTRAQHEDRVKDLKERTTAAETREGIQYQRAETERGRADGLAVKVGELATEFGATAVHLLKSLPSAEEVSRDGSH